MHNIGAMVSTKGSETTIKCMETVEDMIQMSDTLSNSVVIERFVSGNFREKTNRTQHSS